MSDEEPRATSRSSLSPTLDYTIWQGGRLQREHFENAIGMSGHRTGASG
jgi:hypothetical protein